MKAIEISPGSACWRAQVSATERNWKTFKTMIGELPEEDLDRCIDVEEFTAQVWDLFNCQGYMMMTMSMSGTDVVWIVSENVGDGPEVVEFTYNSNTCPTGLGGRWIVYQELQSGEES